MIIILLIKIIISGGAVQVAVLYGLPAERGVAKSKGDDDNDDDDGCDDDDDDDDELRSWSLVIMIIMVTIIRKN